MAVTRKRAGNGRTTQKGRITKPRTRGLIHGNPDETRPIAKGVETTEHLSAFETWYANGRSTRKLSEIIGVPESTLYEWKNRFGWKQRADNRDQEAAEIATQASIKERAQRLTEQLQTGTLLRLRGAEYFQEKGVSNAREAVAAVKIGIEIERQADNLPEYVKRILNADENELGDLEGLEREIEAEIQRRLIENEGVGSGENG